MNAALALSSAIDRLNTSIGKVAGWAILVAILICSGNAIARHFFGISSNAWLELQWYLFGAAFLLCAPWTLCLNEHIRIDIISTRLAARTRDWIDLACLIVFLLPFVSIMIVQTTPFFISSLKSGEVSASAGGLLIWPAKGLIWIGFILLAFQWLSELIKKIALLKVERKRY